MKNTAGPPLIPMTEKIMKNLRKKKLWVAGDYFLVSQNDGLVSLCQVITIEPRALNSLVASFYDVRYPRDTVKIEKFPDIDKIISILFVTRDFLDNGTWVIVANGNPRGIELFGKYQQLKSKGFVGAEIVGTRIVNAFLNAFYGLLPWNDWHAPAFLDGLLLSPEKKPKNLIYKKT